MTWYRRAYGCVLYPPGSAEPADEQLPRPAIYRWGDGEAFENPELGRQLLRGNPAATAYVARIARTGRPSHSAAWPAPHTVGTPEWYDSRTEDHLRRGGAADDRVSRYYQGYGKKYCIRFSADLYPQLSDDGQRWVIDARMHLHLAIEEALLRDPHAYADLERDGQAFEEMAYGTHSDAYLAAGLASLPLADLSRIFAAPDMKDLLTPKAVAQVVETAPAVVRERLRDLLHTSDEV